MRDKISLNEWWAFSKTCQSLPETYPSDWEIIDLPHTWNAADGQDGNNDYYRGACWYASQLEKPYTEAGARIYLEFEGASASADVYVNGTQAVYHEGGYSTFRTDVTDLLTDGENLICVCADNRNRTNIYPQMADFTFYGGIYRDVNMIIVSESHFDLDCWGSPGLAFSSKINGDDAAVTLDAYIANPQQDDSVQFVITDAEDYIVAEGFVPSVEQAHMILTVPDAHLWQGVEDPYLYTVTARLIRRNETLDEVSARLGIREYYVDPDKGFFLNGIPTPLRGVSRHQDRLGVGNALTKEEHWEDALIICELGANTVRLAHYQHNQAFYDACDSLGLVVWAEIPFISVMSNDPEAHQNCRSQMQELIYQNYNHPSICFWGISNEITIGGTPPQLLENLKDLNALVKSIDNTRLTTIAHVSMLPKNSPQNQITDVLSYNHYFGWYGGTLEQNEVWLDAFHAEYPDRPLGISEYGAEGIITYHNDDPKCRDYSEDYQALYHEHMAKIISERPYLWATHVWNMFDFGCDARDEGGVKGRNNKGLVTMDRKIKKDAFFLYKAYWSDDEFVHVCGRRYSQRPGSTTAIKVYSNLPGIVLYVNGVKFAEQSGDKVFVFKNVPLIDGFNSIIAKSGLFSDSITLQKVAKPNPTYVLVDGEEESDGAANWFDEIVVETPAEMTFNEGSFSIQDTIGSIIENEDAGNALSGALFNMTGMKMKRSMLGMVSGKTIMELQGMMSGMAGDGSDSDQNKGVEAIARLNAILQTIKK